MVESDKRSQEGHPLGVADATEKRDKTMTTENNTIQDQIEAAYDCDDFATAKKLEGEMTFPAGESTQEEIDATAAAEHQKLLDLFEM